MELISSKHDCDFTAIRNLTIEGSDYKAWILATALQGFNCDSSVRHCECSKISYSCACDIELAQFLAKIEHHICILPHE